MANPLSFRRRSDAPKMTAPISLPTIEELSPEYVELTAKRSDELEARLDAVRREIYALSSGSVVPQDLVAKKRGSIVALLGDKIAATLGRVAEREAPVHVSREAIGQRVEDLRNEKSNLESAISSLSAGIVALNIEIGRKITLDAKATYDELVADYVRAKIAGYVASTRIGLLRGEFVSRDIDWTPWLFTHSHMSDVANGWREAGNSLRGLAQAAVAAGIIDKSEIPDGFYRTEPPAVGAAVLPAGTFPNQPLTVPGWQG